MFFVPKLRVLQLLELKDLLADCQKMRKMTGLTTLSV